MTPAAVIPMHTPDEAIAELEHAVGDLGLKAVMLNSMVDRPIPKVADERPDAADLGIWYDMIGLDSAYDYDPVWRKCEELKVSPTFHRGSRGRAFRMSPSNFCYNHIGHFAAASEAVCKAIFLGGVTRRFPGLNFAFLEGGVGFACLLYADLIGHWSIRNREALEDVNPANLDPALLLSLAEKYAGPEMAEAIRAGTGISTSNNERTTGGIEELDDYSACSITSKEDFKDLFVEPFYFGCEADDSNNAWAFNRDYNPGGAEIKTLFGSDIGHFDVQDMSEVVTEAFELVEDGRIDAGGFRRFVFENPVNFWGKTNPKFFDGTRVAGRRNSSSFPASSGHARRLLRVGIDDELEQVAVGVADVGAGSFLAAAAFAAAPGLRSLQRRVRRAWSFSSLHSPRPDEAEVSATRPCRRPAQGEAPRLPRLGRVEVDLVGTEIDRVEQARLNFPGTVKPRRS